MVCRASLAGGSGGTTGRSMGPVAVSEAGAARRGVVWRTNLRDSPSTTSVYHEQCRRDSKWHATRSRIGRSRALLEMQGRLGKPWKQKVLGGGRGRGKKGSRWGRTPPPGLACRPPLHTKPRPISKSSLPGNFFNNCNAETYLGGELRRAPVHMGLKSSLDDQSVGTIKSELSRRGFFSFGCKVQEFGVVLVLDEEAAALTGGEEGYKIKSEEQKFPNINGGELESEVAWGAPGTVADYEVIKPQLGDAGWLAWVPGRRYRCVALRAVGGGRQRMS